MKKILSAVLALALVCCLAVTAMAVGYDLSVDKTIIEPGTPSLLPSPILRPTAIPWLRLS